MAAVHKCFADGLITTLIMLIFTLRQISIASFSHTSCLFLPSLIVFSLLFLFCCGRNCCKLLAGFSYLAVLLDSSLFHYVTLCSYYFMQISVILTFLVFAYCLTYSTVQYVPLSCQCQTLIKPLKTVQTGKAFPIQCHLVFGI